MKNYFKILFLSTILFAISCDDNSNKKETKSSIENLLIMIDGEGDLAISNVRKRNARY